ncbi:MAG: hypothetical protein LBD78_01440 [Spirochaetaceae bacterium]|jgi:hypothetical protein|nr:hypothetical protein [Spirochaetaceae bacterium]
MVTDTASVMRIIEAGEREATVLEQGAIQVMIDDDGGMIPLLAGFHNGGAINAHWLPWFRSYSGKKYNDAEHGAFWKADLLYHIAGNFPCIPNFGPGEIIDGVTMPPHGWSANQKWLFIAKGVDEASGAAWALSAMESPDKAMPLFLKKIDAVIPGDPVHYTSITVKNNGAVDIPINAGFHNSLGAPFLQPGCRISGAAERWATPPLGGEFDTTTRLVPGTEFPSLDRAPLEKGGKVDISLVPGPIGYTDFASGVIPHRSILGWSALVNPMLKLIYICFFTGPLAAAEDDIVLRFNDLWMQYGGRRFTPWAPYDGAADLTYCLGTENAIAAYACGLKYSRMAGTVLGAPTTVSIPAGGEKTIRYGSLFAPYEGSVPDEGIRSIIPEERRLVITGISGESRAFSADSAFTVLKAIAARS